MKNGLPAARWTIVAIASSTRSARSSGRAGWRGRRREGASLHELDARRAGSSCSPRVRTSRIATGTRSSARAQMRRAARATSDPPTADPRRRARSVAASRAPRASAVHCDRAAVVLAERSSRRTTRCCSSAISDSGAGSPTGDITAISHSTSRRALTRGHHGLAQARLARARAAADLDEHGRALVERALEVRIDRGELVRAHRSDRDLVDVLARAGDAPRLARGRLDRESRGELARGAPGSPRPDLRALRARAIAAVAAESGPASSLSFGRSRMRVVSRPTRPPYFATIASAACAARSASSPVERVAPNSATISPGSTRIGVPPASTTMRSASSVSRGPRFAYHTSAVVTRSSVRRMSGAGVVASCVAESFVAAAGRASDSGAPRAACANASVNRSIVGGAHVPDRMRDRARARDRARSAPPASRTCRAGRIRRPFAARAAARPRSCARRTAARRRSARRRGTRPHRCRRDDRTPRGAAPRARGTRACRRSHACDRSTIDATPKSVSTARPPLRITLSGLTSRWITPARCAADSADPICTMMSTICASSNGSARPASSRRAARATCGRARAPS